MNVSYLCKKQASENRFFSLALPEGRENRKDLAINFEIFERLQIDIVVYSVTLRQTV